MNIYIYAYSTISACIGFMYCCYFLSEFYIKKGKKYDWVDIAIVFACCYVFWPVEAAYQIYHFIKRYWL